MDPQVLQQLLALMEEQVKVMSDLAELSRKKSHLLVDGELEGLDVLLRGEQALILQLGRLEDRRFRLQTDLAAQLGIHPSALTLETLLQKVPPAYADRCRQVAEGYSKAADELAHLNHLNADLVQQAMAFLDFSLQLLGVREPPSGRVYSPKGQRTQPGGGLRRLDNRV